jgi:predicted Zn-dependent protease
MPIELPPDIAAPSDRNPPPNSGHFFKLMTLVISLILVISLALPRVVDVLVWNMPLGIEQQLGNVMAPAYDRMGADSPRQVAIQTLLNRLVAELPSPQRERQYKLIYIDDNTVNAGAVPGDRVLVFRGLVDQTESENELMMVLGHELGHFANRDHLRGLGQKLLLQLTLGWLMGDVGSLQTIATSGVVALNEAQFSQHQETQADELGLTLLQGLYGHAAGATDFFDRMSQQNQASIDWLDSHPAPARRVEELRDLIRRRGYPVKQRKSLDPILRPINVTDRSPQPR